MAQQQPLTLPDRARLALVFDADRLRADLAAVEASTWTDHLVKQNYEGRWDVLPLCHAAGATHPVMQTYSDPNATEFVDAVPVPRPLFPGGAGIVPLPGQGGPPDAADAGFRIKEHSDHDLAADMGAARIHIPIITNHRVSSCSIAFQST